MVCSITKEICAFQVINREGIEICGIAKGKELTDGFGYIKNIKVCPLFVPSNFKKPAGKQKAIMRKRLWEMRHCEE